MSAGRAGRKPNPPKPDEPWYTVLMKIWFAHVITDPKPTEPVKSEVKTTWRHQL
jgi:hypothetical protein